MNSDAFDKLMESKGEGGKRRLRDLFDRMPIMGQHCRLLAADQMETARHPQPQDFYDFDHGTIPPIYSDAFVTFDNRLIGLIKKAARGKAELITTLAQLQGWIEATCA